MQPSVTGYSNHLALPYHCDSGPQDQCIATLIEKIKCGEVVHPADAPSLVEYMLDSSHDSLIGRLKDYLEPLNRAGKNSELLATYWVVYVMWQCYRTPECFKRLPHWLRPTECQIGMPHPMCIDFIPWPRLRDGIIRTYSGNWSQACSMLAALSEHMEFTSNTLFDDELSSSHSLQSAVGDIGKWKLREGFFLRYRQFQGLCDS
ncbi:hypothetical protein EDB81DRAFT_347791 [Dactylonectria macrodidyma]|uniref:Uncharacterized protein n=1 Tax=Dactylonectria macrodidyma TaxID=307937 RepID=A0A9P9FHD9_9HYPO|nr:hypothetical protein EDB81DRAFT_347791 [Dactylonectria macrodidyma]